MSLKSGSTYRSLYSSYLDHIRLFISLAFVSLFFLHNSLTFLHHHPTNREEQGTWKEETLLHGHSDWVRDVAFAPNIGVSRTYLASCSQDKTVLLWSKDPEPGTTWQKRLLGSQETPHVFSDVIWRVSWSLAGNLLAVSCGDNKISLWKEALNGDWVQVGDVNQASNNNGVEDGQGGQDGQQQQQQQL